MRRISSLLLLFALSAPLTGCGTTVRPQSQPIDPVPVILADYGVHSSLMLPTPDGRFVEYSFGDFGYAALNHGGPHNALGALLVSSQAGIGRRFLTIRPGDETPQPAYAPKTMQKFYANRFQVYALVKELDQRYRRGAAADAPVHNPVTDNVYVRDTTEHYSVTNNCNHMTARMLRQLGCEVSGNTGASGYKVVGRQQLPAAPEPAALARAKPPAKLPPTNATPANATAVKLTGAKSTPGAKTPFLQANGTKPAAAAKTTASAKAPAPRTQTTARKPAGAVQQKAPSRSEPTAATPPTPQPGRAIRAASYSSLSAGGDDSNE